jgi:hypothetical protein
MFFPLVFSITTRGGKRLIMDAIPKILLAVWFACGFVAVGMYLRAWFKVEFKNTLFIIPFIVLFGPILWFAFSTMSDEDVAESGSDEVAEIKRLRELTKNLLKQKDEARS